ncbi:MAG: hypothetical protein R3F33_17375 [Planctomycetota bacterium]
MRSTLPAALAIVALCVSAAILYGIVHDQITVRISLEYFTLAHPRVIESEDPTLLALTWGVLATWWVGLPLGVLLAWAALAGPLPQRQPATLVAPLFKLLLTMGALAAGSAWLAHQAGAAGRIQLTEPLYSLIPLDRHLACLTAAAAHNTSYLAGFIGGLWLAWRVRASRRTAQ